MGIEWYRPRKRAYSSEPRITISERFISLNEAAVERYFKDKERAKIGYDKDTKKLFLVPIEIEKNTEGMKIIKNEKSTSRYINAKGVFDKFKLTDTEKKIIPELRGDYRCSWDEDSKAVVIDLKKL